MKTELNLMMATMFLGAVAGFGQPIIMQQPQSCTSLVGTTATFSALATNGDLLAYQWQKLSGNWTDLADRTNATVVVTIMDAVVTGDQSIGGGVCHLPNQKERYA